MAASEGMLQNINLYQKFYKTSSRFFLNLNESFVKNESEEVCIEVVLNSLKTRKDTGFQTTFFCNFC